MALRLQVVDTDSDARLKEEAIAVAKQVCAGNAQTTKQVKRMIHEGYGRGVDAALQWEGDTALADYVRMAAQSDQTRTGLANALKSRTSSKL